MKKEHTALAIPNGSLFEKTTLLLKRAGANFHFGKRQFETEVEGLGNFGRITVMRPQAIPLSVKRGIVAAGICGWDCVVESGLEKLLELVTELQYSKATSSPVQVVVFSKNKKIVDSPRTRVLTEYPNLARRVFEKAVLDFSHGSTEVQILSGAYDFGVGITETGESLHANGLKIVKAILVSPTVVVARKATPEIKLFGEILKGAIDAKKYQLVKMNTDEKAKEKILEILPAMKSPTINELANGSFSIETIIGKSSLVSVLMDLRKIGATDILVQDINIILT